MPQFSKSSVNRLLTCHPDLQRIAYDVIKDFDFSVICGHRGRKEQDEAFITGRSKIKWPNSKHNDFPSRAMDIAPYPIDWPATDGKKGRAAQKAEMEKFRALAFHIKATAKALGIRLRHGADWDMDGDTKDERFLDWPHWELV